MSNQGQPYTPEGFGDVYRGMGFGDFKSLTDEEVGVLRDAHNEHILTTPLFTAPDGDFSEPAPNLIAEGIVLSNFIEWRRYGVPDRDVTQEDIDQYLEELVAWSKQQNPDFGELPTEYQEWSSHEQHNFQQLCTYLYIMRDRSDYMTIDDYSLFETLGFTGKDVQILKAKKVLVPGGEYNGPDGGIYGVYELSRVYYEYLLADIYVADEEQ